jgi:hypothetical protein
MNEIDEDITNVLDKLLITFKDKKTNINFQKIESIQSYNLYCKKIKSKNSKLKTLLSYWDIILLGFINFMFVLYLIYCVAVYYNTKLPQLDSNTIKTMFTKLLADNWMKFNGITELTKEECAIPVPEIFFTTMRPIDDCSMCINVNEIKRVEKITKKEFLEKYAYSGIPVIITDAAKNWTAAHVVNYTFLKDLYKNLDDIAYRKRISKIDIHRNENSPILNTFNSIVETDDQRSVENEKDVCQFFRYRTNFTGLDDLFEMDETDERFNKPWYVGWSNCNSYAADILRNHYSRPYFLPDESEISRIDWIFMGTPNYGANIHIGMRFYFLILINFKDLVIHMRERY